MLTINAKTRTEQGKNASRRLRIANKFPAIIYGGQGVAISISLDQESLMNNQAKLSFYNEVLQIVIDGKKIKVKVKAIQRHPFKPKLHHIDFIRV